MNGGLNEAKESSGGTTDGMEAESIQPDIRGNTGANEASVPAMWAPFELKPHAVCIPNLGQELAASKEPKYIAALYGPGG